MGEREAEIRRKIQFGKRSTRLLTKVRFNIDLINFNEKSYRFLTTEIVFFRYLLKSILNGVNKVGK